MKEIKTIGDLYSYGLLKGLYPSLKKYYMDRVDRAWDPSEPNCLKPETYIEKEEFWKEPVEWLTKVDYSKIMNFGHGKKEKTLKLLFENLGFEWDKKYELRWNEEV